MNTIQNKINALRAQMQKLNLDAWYISGTDPHSSEYLPDSWQTRKYISGFTGSYGIVVITQNEAALWTDTRYFIQAEEQLKGTGISMQKLRVPNAVSPEGWLNNKLKEGSRVGIDAQTISLSGFRNLQEKLAEKKIELVETPDLLNEIWEDRPANSSDLIFELDTKYAGVSRLEKQQKVTGELKNKKADLHVFTMLDEVAWLYNLRGSDINYNPVFNAFALMGENENYLFVENIKVSY
jgi:Xaa-Pro aminopeptidase